MSGPVEFLLGNEAILEGALAAGADFFAGYPITPSSEIAELAARRLPAIGGTYLQMEDELASIAAVIGASLAGARAFTATSGPGFSLMQENLGLAYMAEVPCVVINIQRSGPSTGLATRPAQGDVMQSRWGTHGDARPVVLCPSSVEQCYRLTWAAFSLSEQLRMPVILLSDEIIGHLREDARLSGEGRVSRRFPDCGPETYRPYRADPDGVPPLAAFGSDYVFHVTGSMHSETGFPTSDPVLAARTIKRLADKVESARGRLSAFCAIHRFGTEPGTGQRVTIIAYGATVRAATEAGFRLAAGGSAVTVLELQCLWPFPGDTVTECCANADVVVVAEMNMGQIIGEVQRILPGREVTGVHRFDGEPLTPAEIAGGVRGL